MTTKEKLKLHAEIEQRNRERIAAHVAAEAEREEKRAAYLKASGVHKAVEVYTESIISSLTGLAQLHSLSLDEVSELFINTFRAGIQAEAQK